MVKKKKDRKRLKSSKFSWVYRCPCCRHDLWKKICRLLVT